MYVYTDVEGFRRVFPTRLDRDLYIEREKAVMSNYGVSDSERFQQEWVKDPERGWETKVERQARESWVTKDSGERAEYASGMVRDTQAGKPDFSLCLAPGVPYEEQLLTRFAALMSRGAEKYGRANWTLADSAEELERFKASAFRHFMQWVSGETDEDHASAVCFNLMAAEFVKRKLES